ncbi:MAG: AraC family transcriptional regulator [Clostridia bacterium]|nr:AraC family transcriptional regulator [Clostridia bacterium]
MIYESSKKYKGAEPFLFYCAYDEYVEPGTSFGPVVRDAYCIECIISGSGTIVINDKVYPIRKGDCYVTLPDQRLVYTADKKESRKGVYCLLIGMRVGQVLSEAGIDEENPYAPPEAFDDIVRIISQMIDMNSNNDRGADLRRTASIYELLGVIMKNKPVSDKNEWVKRALGIFEAGYHSRITVSDVAAAVGFERCYFSSIFKEYTGVSPHKYLTSLRIAKACELFTTTSLPISVIAESVGIDASNFARIFKAEMGVSPLKYREYVKQSK